MVWSLFGVKSRQAGVIQVEVLKTYWQLVGPTQLPITCALYHTGAGLELRTYRGMHDLLYSLDVQTENQAADQAAAWKAAALTFAGFTDMDERPASTNPARYANPAEPTPSQAAVEHVPFSGGTGR